MCSIAVFYSSQYSYLFCLFFGCRCWFFCHGNVNVHDGIGQGRGLHRDCDSYINNGGGAEAGGVGCDEDRCAGGNLVGCSGSLGAYFYGVVCGCNSSDVGDAGDDRVDGDGVSLNCNAARDVCLWRSLF